jgi:hypothetical protein
VIQNKLNQALYERRIYKRQAENWRFAFIGLAVVFVCFIAILNASVWPVFIVLIIWSVSNVDSIGKRINQLNPKLVSSKKD